VIGIREGETEATRVHCDNGKEVINEARKLAKNKSAWLIYTGSRIRAPKALAAPDFAQKTGSFAGFRPAIRGKLSPAINNWLPDQSPCATGPTAGPVGALPAAS
jgi:hypothetical protein